MGLAGQGDAQIRAERGYAMAALLVSLSVMAVLMGMAMPVWSTMVKREKEEELIWRGKQYAQAIGLFQRKYANAFPPSLDVLVDQKFLRKKYKDPITNDDFQLIPAGTNPNIQGQGQQNTPLGSSQTPARGGPTPAPTGANPPSAFQPTGLGGTQPGTPNLGIAGVVSKSKDSSLKIYNGRQKYNEWTFVYLQTSQGLSVGFSGLPMNMPAGGRGGGNFPNMPPNMNRGGSPFSPIGPGGRGPQPPFGRGNSTMPPPPFGQGGFPGGPPPGGGFSPFGRGGQQPVSRPPG